MIHTDNLTRQFGSNVAVDSLTLDVAEGEVLGLLGPNGAGKTTTVRMLSCLIAPTSGTATVGGFRVGRDDNAIRSITGILTESPGLYERFSPRQNLRYFAQLYGMDAARREARVEHFLRLLGLWERRDEPVSGFSKGMKQKLAIARALVHQPKVVFMDEPTSALDPESARTVRDFIEQLRGEGCTVILCTHNLDEADRLCDRIAIVKQRLIRIDSPSRLRTALYGRRIEVQVREVTPGVVAAVQSLGLARDLEAADGRLTFSSQNPDEENPAIVRAIVQAGGEVQFVSEVRHTLEEVYLSLIGEEGHT